MVTRLKVNLDSISSADLPTGMLVAEKSTIKRDSILLLIIAMLVIVNIAWFVYIIRQKRKNVQ